MSLLSLRKNGKNNSYIKLIIHESHLLQNSKATKNIFPYIISIQFNKSLEKIISPIKNANEIFNPSLSKFKYFLRKQEQKVLIKINCLTKTSFMTKKIASNEIELDIVNMQNNSKIIKKWYYLKNKNNEKIIKLLISIDFHYFENASNNLNDFNSTTHSKRERINENKFTINRPKIIDIDLNTLNKKNFNIIANNVFMTNYNYLTSPNDSSINDTSCTIKINNNNKNLFSKILHKHIDKNKKLKSNNDLHLIIEKFIQKLEQKFSFDLNYFNKEKESYEKKYNEYFRKEDDLEKQKNKLKNEVRLKDKKREIYENKYLDLNINYIEMISKKI